MGLYNLSSLQTDQIRLLRVVQEASGRLRCFVTIHNLNEEGLNFSALSYTWGPCHRDGVHLRRPSAAKENPTTILCNDESVEVTDNLHDFLCLWVARQDSSMYIWIDALCIDQDNIPEKSQQVNFMGHIYTAAGQVLVWLGPEDDSTILAFELMQRLIALEPGARAALNPDGVSVSNKEPSLVLCKWKALSHFFARTWFSRTWIIQEAVLARSCTVLCGSHTISWKTLVTLSDFLATSNWATFLNNPSQLGEHVNRWHNTPGRLFAQHISWKRSDKDSLLGALIHARPSICEDPRDKVYSQLHLGRANIFPNYTHSVTEVYILAAECILKQSESMLLLTCIEGEDFQNPTYGLPSWVPDWSVAEYVGLRMTGYRHFQAAGDRIPAYSISHDKRMLTVEAVKVDDIEEACEEKKNLRAKLHSSSLWRLLSRLDSTEGTTRDAQDGEQAVWRTLMTNRGSIPTDQTVRYPAPDEIEQSFRSWVLWRYALANEEPTTFPVPSTTPSFLPERVELERARLRAATEPAYLAKLAQEASAYDLHFSYASLLRPFRTKQGYFGIGTQCLREGDSVWIVSGCRVPILLRRIDGSKHYRLVGGSYIHGLMDGEGLSRKGVEFEMVTLE